MTRPTPRQREVLRALSVFRTRHGYTPTIRELGDLLGIASTNGVACHLRCLEKKGLISRPQGVRARALTITRAGRVALEASL